MERKIAYLREYEASQNCDLRFVLQLKSINNEDIIKEVTSFVKVTQPLSALIEKTQERIIEVKDNNKESQNEEKICQKTAALDLLKTDEICIKRNNKTVKNTIMLKDFIKNLTTNNSTDVTLHILNQTFIIVVNAPLIRKVRLPSGIYAKFPVEPAKFNSFNTFKEASEFYWYRSLDKVKWLKIGQGYQYEVTDEDLNHYLKMCCIPFSKFKIRGPPVEDISEFKVESLSEFPRCPFEERHEFTRQKVIGNGFRVVSYNILADRYVDGIQFAYCPPKALGIHYRKQLIIKELLGYNADIICLQEVDHFYFREYYKEKFKEMGFKCIYNRKGNCITEGLACVFDQNRFQLLESKHIVLRNELERRKQFRDLLELLDSNKSVKKDFSSQNTSFQATILKEKKTNQLIIVGNTHLYYHPDADHIRLLQGFMVMIYLKSLKNRLSKEHKNISIVFCGDFNSEFTKSLYSYIVRGTIDPSHKDCLKIAPSGDARIFHNFYLTSASGTPKYTNYTSDFKGCLDYIFIEKQKLFVTQVVPITGEEVLQNFAGLPNEYFPSDHLALVVDLQVKSK